MKKVFFSDAVRAALERSGYHGRYFLPPQQVEQIVQIYHRFSHFPSPEMLEILSVFGGRKIYYNDFSSPLEFYYDLSKISVESIGKKALAREKSAIEAQRALLIVPQLMPFADIAGHMFFYTDNKKEIWGVFDHEILHFQGKNLWQALEKFLTSPPH